MFCYCLKNKNRKMEKKFNRNFLYFFDLITLYFQNLYIKLYITQLYYFMIYHFWTIILLKMMLIFGIHLISIFFFFVFVVVSLINNANISLIFTTVSISISDILNYFKGFFFLCNSQLQRYLLLCFAYCN